MAETFRLADKDVRRIGYGAMQLPGKGVMGPPRDRDEAIRVLQRAVELGVNHIDTAQFYGPDVSNELIRAALHPYTDDLALVSKVGSRRDARGRWNPAQAPADLRADVEQNLQSLGVERLTAVNLRRMDEHPGAHTAVPLEDQLAEMVALRDEGKIAGVGVSTVSADVVATAQRLADVVCVQNAFSMVDRSDQPVLDYCRDNDIAYVPYFPLGSAFPNTPKVTAQPRVQEIATAHGASASQVGLAWLLARAENILLIPGTSSVAHLEENMGTGSVELTPEELAELDQLQVG